MQAVNVVRRLFDSGHGLNDRLIPRWTFLRSLALIYFSAFYSLLFQIKGLIGPQGVLPAQQFLATVARAMGPLRYWYAPSIFWISASSHMLTGAMILGLFASLFALLNLWPRLSFLVCFVCFLSFTAASNVFSNYQSDGMLLEAGFLSLFLTPGGAMPGWGAAHPPTRASFFLLQWEWFRIYFESGMVKLLSGDEQWRNMTAMDEYYQNGPLPTWVGWYVQHLPHWFHAASAVGTLILELGLVFMLFLPRRFRLLCFCIVTPWEVVVILTANYTFLNYLVLSLGFLLLDDESLLRFIPARFRPRPVAQTHFVEDASLSILPEEGIAVPHLAQANVTSPSPRSPAGDPPLRSISKNIGLAVTAIMLSWIAYDTAAEMIGIPLRGIPVPVGPVTALDPFRIANQYGLFARMTRGRYEIEFQGSNGGEHWIAYPFQYKPQALNEPPGIYAPYQPRFDWNLWFASLGDWQQNDMVPLTEERLLANDPDVLALFRNNPFAQSPPRRVRAVLWRYWFTSIDEKRRSGNWWRRELMGLYAPEITLTPDGKPSVIHFPDDLPQHD